VSSGYSGKILPTDEQLYDPTFSLEVALRALDYRRPKQPPSESPSGTQKLYTDENSFWEDAHAEQLWDGRRVGLDQFNITEWVPLQPGALGGSSYATDEAFRYLHFDPSLGHHYRPEGKIGLLRSGIGCARYGAVRSEHGLQYVVGATSSEICDAGVPLLVDEGHYETFIERVRELGSVAARISGRVQLLPQAVISPYEYSRPTYCVSVEYIEMLRNQVDGGDLKASAFITFGHNSGQDWNASFCRFRPGVRNGTISQAVDWLRKYADHYSGEDSRIIADFDAYRSYFDTVPVDFPLRERLAGQVSPERLRWYADRTQSAVIVFGDYVNGDQFKDIKQSTILNRSAFIIEPKGEDYSYDENGEPIL
jgi:hypothetical protein